jgi:hypothetical protein
MNRSVARLAFGLAWLPGCAPSAQYFVDHHAYDEAVCAAEKEEDYPLTAAWTVGPALASDLEPAVHVHAVTRAELEASIGEAGDRVADRVLLLHVVSDARKVRGIEGEFTVSLAGAGVKAPAGSKEPPGSGVVARRELLAALVQETLPHEHVVVDRPGFDDKMKAAAASPKGFLAGLGELLTLGLIPVTELAGVVQTHTAIVSPAEEDYRQKAPAAETLYQSFQGRRGQALAFARPVGDDVALRVRFDARANVASCHFGVEVEVALPPGGSIEERVNRRFANNKMTRLSELGHVAPHGQR